MLYIKDYQNIKKYVNSGGIDFTPFLHKTIWVHTPNKIFSGFLYEVNEDFIMLYIGNKIKAQIFKAHICAVEYTV